MFGRALAALLFAMVGCGTTGGRQTPAAAPSATMAQAQPQPSPKARKVVVLRLQIGDDGAVRDVQVVRSAGPRFDKAATRAATRARFEPPREDGRPIESTLFMTYRFRP
jgi:periplasmic protein TonB